jgi:hypothetical protein
MMDYPLQTRLKPIIFRAEKMRRKHAKEFLKNDRWVLITIIFRSRLSGNRHSRLVTREAEPPGNKYSGSREMAYTRLQLK